MLAHSLLFTLLPYLISIYTARKRQRHRRSRHRQFHALRPPVHGRHQQDEPKVHGRPRTFRSSGTLLSLVSYRSNRSSTRTISTRSDPTPACEMTCLTGLSTVRSSLTFSVGSLRSKSARRNPHLPYRHWPRVMWTRTDDNLHPLPRLYHRDPHQYR